MNLMDFSTEVLIEILDRCDFATRKRLREVCKLFNDLMKSPRLSDDFIWKFNDCFIHENFPPLSSFRMNLTQPRSILLNNLKGEQSAIQNFFKILAPYVKFLELKKPIDFLEYFVALEDIDCENLEDLLKIEEIPATLQKINASSAKMMVTPDFIKLIKSLQNLQTIEVKSLILNSCEMDENLVNFVEVDENLQEITNLCQEPSNRYLDLKPLNLLGLKKIGLEHLKNIKPRDFMKATNLLPEKLKGIFLESLEKISVHQIDDTCFFSHEVFEKLEKVKSVSFFFFDKFCTKCLTSLLNTCPNINDLSLTTASLNGNLIRAFSSHLKYLTFCVTLLESTFGNVFSAGAATFSEITFLIFELHIEHPDQWFSWPSMTKLTLLHLELRENDNFNAKILAKKCPNLDDFQLTCSVFTQQDLIVLLQNLQKLRSFRCSNQITSESIKSWIHIFVEYGQNLRQISFAYNFTGEDLHFCKIADELFEKIPRLTYVENKFSDTFTSVLTRQQFFEKLSRVPNAIKRSLLDNNPVTDAKKMKLD